MHITAATRMFALLGDPVEHSRSPVIQNAAITKAAIDAVYVAMRCNARDVAGLLTGLARANGGGNVTVPHKGVAADAVERPSARVRATRACNSAQVVTRGPKFTAALVGNSSALRRSP